MPRRHSAEFPAPSEADVRIVLSRLGEPEAIAVEAGDRLGVAAPRSAKLVIVLVWIGVIVGLFDLLAVSTSQIGPIEFVLLAIPVVVLIVVAIGLRRQVHRPA